jgi:PII-like signaling protein
MTSTIHRRRVEILADEPLITAIIRLAADAGITGYTLMPTMGGAGAHGRWRDDQLSGATAKVMMVAITSPEHAAAFVDLLAPLLESHHLMLLLSDVEVVRGPKFD